MEAARLQSRLVVAFEVIGAIGCDRDARIESVLDEPILRELQAANSAFSRG